MPGLSLFFWLMASAFAVCALCSLYNFLQSRSDLRRASEGSMLGAEFGAFSLPQANLAPNAGIVRRCHNWSVILVSSIACSGLCVILGKLF